MQISDALLSGTAAILLHEMAHIAAALALRVKIHRIGVNWRGPYVVREHGTERRNLSITLAGPGANLAFALLFHRISPNFAFCNLIIGVTNLLPLPSSDGARALNLIRQRRGSLAQSLLSDRLTLASHRNVGSRGAETRSPAEELGSRAA